MAPCMLALLIVYFRLFGRYKEGRVILEYALINEAEGFPSEAGGTSH